MKLDIIAQLVQILRDAPDVGAIEIRRGPFGVWSTVRVSRAGHGVNTGSAHVVVAHPASGPGGPGGGGAALAAAAPAGVPVASGRRCSRSSRRWSVRTTGRRSLAPSRT